MTVHLFVRQQGHVSVAQANRCDGVIAAVQTSRGNTNRGLAWWDSLTCERMGFLWLPLPGMWEPPQVREAVRFLGSVGATAVVVNAEPRSPKHRPRWEDGNGEDAERYMDVVCDEAAAHGLLVGFSSWARISARRTFPWTEFIDPSDFVIPQPYEVHGRTGRAYVDACLAEYRAAGATDVWVGRGAHELDRTDHDAWRTRAEILAHRKTTPPNAREAWWLPAGKLPESVLAAILEDRDVPDTLEPFDRRRILDLAERAKPTDPAAADALVATHAKLAG